MVAVTRVAVIPGFMGSDLAYRGGRGGKTKLWYSPKNLLVQGPAALGLATDGVSPGVGGLTLFADGPVGLGVYEPLLTALGNAGLTPAFWAHDWRLDQRTLAAQFVTWLRSQPLADPFYVVAHSNGGIIAQLAYTMWRALPGTPATWQTTVYMATPHGGTYTAAQSLAGLYLPGTLPLILSGVWGLSVGQQPVLAVIRAVVARALNLAICSWPGLYNLLPNSFGGYSELDPNDERVLVKAAYGVDNQVQQQWLTAAAVVMSDIIAGFALPRPYEVILTGSGYKTALGVGDQIFLDSQFAYSYSNSGDGTVTALRAQIPLPRIVTHEFDPCGHQSICGSAAPLADLLTDFVPPSTPPSLGLLKEVPNLPPVLSTIPHQPPAAPGRLVNPAVNIAGDP